MGISVSEDNYDFFRCFSSKTRLKIIELLSEGAKNIGEMANQLKISSTIVARHISMLEKAGIVVTNNVQGKRGIQRICSLSLDEALIVFKTVPEEVPLDNTQSLSISVGQFSSYKVLPTCGLASAEKIIGVFDDPRYFSSPERLGASILWFGSGFVEYIIPSYLFTNENIKSLEVSMEICSEYPLYKQDYPSDIYFYMNDLCIGMYTSPGDFGNKKGRYTPDWWKWTQYGLLKTIKITNSGTFIDGVHLSDITLQEIDITRRKDVILKIASPADAEHAGGITLFGKDFGNYNKDIEVKVEL